MGPSPLLKGSNRSVKQLGLPMNHGLGVCIPRSGATMALAKKFSAARFWRDTWDAWVWGWGWGGFLGVLVNFDEVFLL